ncbi:hypothetical protein SAMN05660209_04686 [Geodermatophilus africanus]|uniref:Uncharacterized protein n=1 Tax=Geodermatophilus africanus TaxID=1137993 RepID=A0A1H3QBS3_9ACTN|nr:hypothetical protein [Geodermatophilus africanus]SDZ10538.1 hypothetical protein SAMN05660209_04686 [Geodermatophilus africanus]
MAWTEIRPQDPETSLNREVAWRVAVSRGLVRRLVDFLVDGVRT